MDACFARSLCAATALVLCLTATSAFAQRADISATNSRAGSLAELLEYTTAPVALPDRAMPGLSVPVQLGADSVMLDIWPVSNRSDAFRLLEQGADGVIREVDAPAPWTVRGEVRGAPGSLVCGELRDGQLRVAVEIEDAAWEIQPLSDFLADAGAITHVIYRRGDIAPLDQTRRCGLDTSNVQVSDEPPGGIAGTGDVVCDIACDADREYYQLNGSSVINTMADIENIVNRMETIYQSTVDIQFETTVILVRTAEPDPYTSSVAATLLNELINEWNSNQGSIFRDVVHLFTGKNIQGGILGIAQLGTVCSTSNAYSLAQSRWSTNLVNRTCVTAHEIGHTFNAVHCDNQPTCFIMCSNTNGCDNNCSTFETFTINQIVAYRDSVSCLVPLADPIAPPFIDNFPDAAVDAAKWSYILRANTSENAENEPSPPRSLDLNALAPADGLQDDIRTNFILMGGLPEAVVQFHYEARGVENGEQLIIEYWSTGLRWVELGRLTSNGATQSTFTQVTYDIPLGGRWNEGRIRFRTDVSDSGDHWYIDNVYVGAPPVVTHTVNFTSAPSGVPLTVSPPDTVGMGDGTTPFSRTYEDGTTITVTAPASSGGQDFSTFLVNGVPNASNPVMVTIDAATTIEAVYASSASTVTVNSTPVAGVTIMVAPPDNGGNGDGVTPFQRTYAGGTSVTFTAPVRPTVGANLLAFYRWTIDAAGQPENQAAVTVSISGQTLAAEYVIVGDMNGDGVVNNFDIDPFVLALTDPDGFAAQFPNVDRLRAGDVNGDGVMNNFDIDPFVGLLTG